ncbi:MAG: Nif3-like dinuclear metal center hexameric protein [Verrucomicrobia bacterium]|jgi:dinuclear metal center YbgI/SA1388 family protein|nr:Nif3-like dinuclear metal center hexameric protein [Verrucomicrobiota bacterium]
MAVLQEIVAFCDERTRRREIEDFPGSYNGLQLENNGTVTSVAAAVDAGEAAFRRAIEAGVDFLIVHHGMLWTRPEAYAGPLYRKLKTALDGNLAVYSSHLPLDAHKEIGNNRLLAGALQLEVEGFFLPVGDTPVALLAKAPQSRDHLLQHLQAEFPSGVTAMEFGSAEPRRIAILTGSGRSALPYLKQAGTDTLVTGELRQEHFTYAQENELNLYCCGHYATETYGVRALAGEVADRFNLPTTFLATGCPL